MRKNILNFEKSGLFFALIITAIILVMSAPVTAFSTETTESSTSETDASAMTEEPEGETEDSSFVETTEETGNDEITVDDNTSENPEGQEEVIDSVEEETPTEEALLLNPESPPVNTVRYNAIFFGGLNIVNNNWDHIDITVTNVKTGAVQEGYLDYRSGSALLGYLTSGSHTDTHNYYKIEARIYMPTGEVIVIYGSSTGTASNGGGYFTISFKAGDSATIDIPGDITSSEVEISDPSVPLILPESGIKKNPTTSDSQLVYIAAAFAALGITLAVCLVRIRVFNKKL